MPIYEFQCDACGHQFEMLRKINDELPPCPECNKSDVRKLVSSAAFHLKGSGWYKSDYKNTGAKTESNKSEGDANKENKKEEGGKTDNGTATKSENKSDKKLEGTNKSAAKDAS